MKNIIKNAENSQETPISEAVKIKEIDSKFKEDNIDKEYASKTYQVTSSLPMKSYKVKLEELQEEEKTEFKITDLNNNPKTEFEENEKFKILIPIEKIKQEINFKITVEATIEAKPVIYAIPNDELYQDFAIPGTLTEEIVNESTEEQEIPEEEIDKKEPEIPQEKKLPVTGM